MKPNVYLAGKIGKNDFRHYLIPRLGNHTWADGQIETKWFCYVGPFFVSCDHACNHGPNTHGAIAQNTICEAEFTRQQVISNNMAALESADLVIVYITSLDCYGTVFEIGWAKAKEKRVVICFAPGIDHSDLWVSTGQVDAIYEDINLCCLKRIVDEEARHVCR
jgi:hypothetical protein